MILICRTNALADPGGAAGTCPPNRIQSFIFAYVFAKKHPCQRLAPPPPTGNPGSATVMYVESNLKPSMLFLNTTFIPQGNTFHVYVTIIHNLCIRKRKPLIFSINKSLSFPLLHQFCVCHVMKYDNNLKFLHTRG